MKIKELAEYLKDKDPEAEVIIWSWFADGEHLWTPHLPVGGAQWQTEGLHGNGVIVGCFDNCIAHHFKRPT